MWLYLAHPTVATRDCEHCRAWRYNEDTGQLARDARGQPIARYRQERLPCEFLDDYGNSSCPKGSPDADIALWPPNVAAYQHYRRCKTVGRFPEDSLVESQAVVIADVEAAWERHSQEQLWTRLRHSNSFG